MIWRDDDVLQTENGSLADLLRIDDLFQKYAVTHTVAVLAYTLTDDLARAILERGMEAQLHGWAHDDHAIDAAACNRLGEAADAVGARIGIRPTIFYPPFNHSSALTEAAARAHRLVVSTARTSLKDYLADTYDPAVGVINFHFWHPERVLLEPALRKYTDGGKRSNISARKPARFSERA